MALHIAGEPVVVHMGPSDPDGEPVITTPWGVTSPVTVDGIPGKPGHMKATPLTFIGSDIIERLLAGDTPIIDSDYRCLFTATIDGPRVFFHIWAPNGHWVWELHECVYAYGYGSDYDNYDYDDLCDDRSGSEPLRSLP